MSKRWTAFNHVSNHGTVQLQSDQSEIMVQVNQRSLDHGSSPGLLQIPRISYEFWIRTGSAKLILWGQNATLYTVIWYKEIKLFKYYKYVQIFTTKLQSNDQKSKLKFLGFWPIFDFRVENFFFLQPDSGFLGDPLSAQWRIFLKSSPVKTRFLTVRVLDITYIFHSALLEQRPMFIEYGLLWARP